MNFFSSNLYLFLLDKGTASQNSFQSAHSFRSVCIIFKLHVFHPNEFCYVVGYVLCWIFIDLVFKEFDHYYHHFPFLSYCLKYF